METRLQDYRQK